jgi:hypothetical protein
LDTLDKRDKRTAEADADSPEVHADHRFRRISI